MHRLGIAMLFVSLYGCDQVEPPAPVKPVAARPEDVPRSEQKAGTDPYADARRQMVRSIEEPASPFATPVRDPLVLAAMRTVPRHLFVPEGVRRFAYDPSRALPIGETQTISAPDVVAAMTAALALEGDEKVLEIGTGSGYQAAVLAEIAREVYTIEIVEPLGKRAEGTLEKLGYDNVHVRIGDGYQGWPEHAPFDAVIVTAAPDHIPQPLIEQLQDGGRMVIPVGRVGRVQQLQLLRKSGDELSQEGLMDVVFVPMTGEAQKGRQVP
jgi:protein-L-isoaspartate(D-aspartate) O-methyltransferase